MALVAPGTEMRSRFVMPDGELPWLSDADLDVYVDEFERSGFVGPLNRYRNIDRDWEDLQAMRGRPIEVPALFVGGDRDGPTLWGAPQHRALPRHGAEHAGRARARRAAGTGPSRSAPPRSTRCSPGSSRGL